MTNAERVKQELAEQEEKSVPVNPSWETAGKVVRYVPEHSDPWSSDEVHELFTALSKAQGELQAATKDKTNPFYSSKYADLEAVMAVSRGPLSKHGLCVTQVIRPTERGSVLVTILGHSSGQWIRSETPIKPEKNGIHAIASAITYMRRYAYMSIVGISTEDDDGNNATKGG